MGSVGGWSSWSCSYGESAGGWISRWTARAATAVSSVPIAKPSARLTTAVAIFCASGAPVLNGYTAAAIVASLRRAPEHLTSTLRTL